MLFATEITPLPPKSKNSLAGGIIAAIQEEIVAAQFAQTFY